VSNWATSASSQCPSGSELFYHAVSPAEPVFVLIAPSLFAASIYMILSRIIRLTDGELRCINPARNLTKIFILGDVLEFFIQSGGTCLLCFIFYGLP
jgi:hypothetical protein